jgi:hypothetical protein
MHAPLSPTCAQVLKSLLIMSMTTKKLCVKYVIPLQPYNIYGKKKGRLALKLL